MKRLIAVLITFVAAAMLLTACGEGIAQARLRDHAENDPFVDNPPVVVSESDKAAEPVIYIEEERYYYDDIGCSCIVLTATDLNTGEVVWTYNSPPCIEGDIPHIEYLGVIDGKAYISEQSIFDAKSGEPVVMITEDADFYLYGRLRALDATTGNILWDNESFLGSKCSITSDRAGTVYVSGYYGPDCYAIDSNGYNVWQIEHDKSDSSHATGITIDGERIAIEYNNGDVKHYSLDGKKVE